MPCFSYHALDARGVELEGTIEASSEDDAVGRLRALGYFPTRVVLAPAGAVPSGPVPNVLDDSDNSDPRVLSFFFKGFVGLGGLIFLLGAIWLIKTATFVLRASKAPGVISEMERVRSSKGSGSTYHAIFTFTDASGAPHTQRSSVGTPSLALERGDSVPVLYEASSPLNSRIDSFQTLWLGPLAIMGFSFVWTSAAYGMLYCATRFALPRAHPPRAVGPDL